MDGFLQAILPTLATRGDIEREAAALRLEVDRRPTWARIVATVAVLAAVAAIPLWMEWFTAIREGSGLPRFGIAQVARLPVNPASAGFLLRACMS
jgi:hypothetical protein